MSLPKTGWRDLGCKDAEEQACLLGVFKFGVDNDSKLVKKPTFSQSREVMGASQPYIVSFELTQAWTASLGHHGWPPQCLKLRCWHSWKMLNHDGLMGWSPTEAGTWQCADLLTSCVWGGDNFSFSPGGLYFNASQFLGSESFDYSARAPTWDEAREVPSLGLVPPHNNRRYVYSTGSKGSFACYPLV